MTLNAFQKSFEIALLEALSEIGFSLKERNELGASERYLFAKVWPSPLEVWIYNDCAEFTGLDVDSRYELPDYEDDSHLMRTMIQDLVAHLKEGSVRK